DYYFNHVCARHDIDSYYALWMSLGHKGTHIYKGDIIEMIKAGLCVNTVQRKP
ncbi:unnamed protein product, partial [marine sediment metagenome]